MFEPEVAEEVINIKLADILRRDFGIDARAERKKVKKATKNVKIDVHQF